MSQVRIVAVTQPEIEGVNSAEEFVAYAARVSNPGNQINKETAPKLLRYLAKHAHWSPFEMVHICMEIKTTRDIGRQILRHRSFSFQEFSQRYAEVTDQFEFREARLQDHKNRQNSIETSDAKLAKAWIEMQSDVQRVCRSHYENALQLGIAKEQARALLPEGMTKSTMYMSGSLRSWIHYCELRMANGTQKEHMEIAKKAWELILLRFPSLDSVLQKEEQKSTSILEKKQMQQLEAVELKPISKDEIEKLVKDFIRDNHYIPKPGFTVYDKKTYQPTWLDPYPTTRLDTQFRSHTDKDSY